MRRALIRAALAATLLVGPGAPAMAQEFSFDPSGAVLDECLGSTPAPAARQSCIGTAAQNCLERHGWATPVEAACLNGEARYWEDRLNLLGYPPDAPGAQAAATAWRGFVEAECAMAAEPYRDTTGYATALAECRLGEHARRNLKMEESGWSR